MSYLGTGIVRWCWVCSIMVVLGLNLSGCSRSPGINSQETIEDQISSGFVDWGKLDWKFKRQPLAKAYMFDRLRVKDPYSKFLKQTWYDDPLDPISLQDFLKLTPEQQATRRERSADHHHQAMALKRIIDRGWEIWLMTLDTAVASEAMIHDMGIITPAIKHLKMATGLNPADPVAWYDLSYFSGVIGDLKTQEECLSQGLDSLLYLGTVESEEMARLRLRMQLDLGWVKRDQGRYRQGMDLVQQAITSMANDEIRTLEEAREAMLLQALLMVDLGNIYDARQLARKLPTWSLPKHRQPHMYVGSAKPALQKENFEQVDSDFAKNWVWIMSFLKQGEKDQAMFRMTERDYLTEFPPHINFRYWRDMGEVLELLGERGKSRLAYGFSILYRPYFPFFPLQGARGISMVLDQSGSGQTYYLGHKHFYVSGSLYSYAANRIVAMEVASDSTSAQHDAEMAVEILSRCIRRGIKPTSCRALRGRANYRLGEKGAAYADLLQAHSELQAQGEPSSKVIKLLAVIKYDQEEYNACLDWLADYLEINPQEGFGWRLSGLALGHLGRLDEAINVLERSTRLDPDAVGGWYNLAVMHLQKGNYDLAREYLVEADRREPGHEQVARLQTLIRTDPVQPIQVTMTPVELNTTTADSLWFAQAEESSGVNMASGLSRQEAEKMVPEMGRHYEANPDKENRLALAQMMMAAEDYHGIQVFLGPLWPSGLTRSEGILLLTADRMRANPARAVGAAWTLSTNQNPVPDSEFWSLVGVICLDNGYPEEGRRALRWARQLDPDNAALQGGGD